MDAAAPAAFAEEQDPAPLDRMISLRELLSSLQHADRGLMGPLSVSVERRNRLIEELAALERQGFDRQSVLLRDMRRQLDQLDDELIEQLAEAVRSIPVAR